MKRISIILSLAASAALLAGCGDDVKLERRTVTYPNGKSVKEDWTFVRKPNGDSVEHGVHHKYFWSGSASESVIWKMGKRDGSAQAWYESGQLKWQKGYDDGKKTGTWRLFYKDGHPWMTATYDQDQLNGQVQVWDKSDATEPKSAQFAKGNCQSGDCALLEVPSVPPTATPTQKVEMGRDIDIIKDFLDQ